MPLARIKNKIESLRQQPEPVRLRAVSIMTITSGALLVVLWLTVLLPLQLRFTRSDTRELPEQVPVQQVTQNSQNRAVPEIQPNVPGQVGGVQDPRTALTPTPSIPASAPAAVLPVATTEPTASSPTLTAVASPLPSSSPSLAPTLPVEVGN